MRGLFQIFFAGWSALFSYQGLAMLPLYIALVAGAQAVGRGEGESESDGSTFWNLGALFLAGFGLTFVFLGLPSTDIGLIFWTHQDLLRLIAGFLLGYVGLSMAGLFEAMSGERPGNGPWFRRLNPYLTAYLVGQGLAAAWLPPEDMQLKTVVVYSGTLGNLASGLVLLGLYTCGMIVPAFVTGQLTAASFRYYGEHIVFMRIFGIILLVYGVLLVLGLWAVVPPALTGFLNFFV